MFPPEPKFKKEAVGDPLFLTPLLEEGRWQEARYVHIQIAFFEIKQKIGFTNTFRTRVTPVGKVVNFLEY